MKFGGLQPFTLSDYPGRSAAVVFTQGCNFRCPFCHNGALWALDRPDDELVPLRAVRSLLEKRRGKLEGLVVTGGEPTVQPDLAEFLAEVKQLDYLVKLDTNGSRPDVLADLIHRRLVDFVAMDVKAPAEKYDELAGVAVDADAIRRSISLIAASGTDHLFRTTAVPELLTNADLQAIRAMIPAGSRHVVQEFKPELAHNPALRGE